MEAVLEEKTQFRQIGNSLGVIVPASVRRAGGFSAGDEIVLECPRPGVITISSVDCGKKNKLEQWRDLQTFVSTHKRSGGGWPDGENFKEVLDDARSGQIDWAV